MRRVRFTTVIALFALLTGLSAAAGAQEPFRINDDQVKQILTRIETGADRFRDSLKNALKHDHFDHSGTRKVMDDYVKSFETATDRLKGRFDHDDQEVAAAVDVLDKAARIDEFMVHHALDERAQRDWMTLRADLDQLALAYNQTWSWGGGVAAHRMGDRDVKHLLGRVEQRADAFKSSLNQALDRSRFDHSSMEDEINRFVKDFERATDRWKGIFDDDDAAVPAAREVLERAASIDAFMRRHALTDRAQRDWADLRATLDELALAYGVTWTWSEI
jgi:hypothetical protein